MFLALYGTNGPNSLDATMKARKLKQPAARRAAIARADRLVSLFDRLARHPDGGRTSVPRPLTCRLAPRKISGRE
jgi:plasmid stabilization system protein ParE